ncbi:hypothetical protein C9374_014315 [Naegleria lovaniensis]|uniref:PH domain-containing protein n=1 Tax=Naegleria lovaniensis TaxID=51637 RepID=A0AA88KB75_NAELO|nr:uncharacterized protein C9374_014315 [Naegleria lovaniensis]KAG2370704.1 hypothetical protein C9374_014315 [Naegleria lovaniensis]
MGKTGRHRKISFFSLQTAQNSELKKEWFWKQGGRIKSWKKRLFVIFENTLYYYASEQDKEPKGAIILKDSSVEICNPEDTLKNGKKPPSENGQSDYYSNTTTLHKFLEKRGGNSDRVVVLLVVKTPFRSFWLLNADLKIVQQWSQFITQVANGDNLESNSKNSFSKHGGSKKLGWMIKSGGKLKASWKQRFFVLRNDMLYYYKPKKESDTNQSSNSNHVQDMVNISELDAKLQNMIAQGVVTFYNSTIQFKQNPAKKKKKVKNAEDLLHEIEESGTSRDRSRSVSSLRRSTVDKRWSLSSISNGQFIIPEEPFDNDFQKTWFAFEIRTPSRTYTIYAKTQDDCDEWVLFLFESILNVMGELSHFVKIGHSDFDDATSTASDDMIESGGSSLNADSARSLLPSLESIISENSSANNNNSETDSSRHQSMDNIEAQPISIISETIFDEIQRRKEDEKVVALLKKSKKRESITFKGSYSEKFAFLATENSLQAELVPIKLYILPGIYTECQTLVVSQPLEIHGAIFENCIIEMHSSKFCEPMIRINSENVRFRKLKLRIISELSNEQIEMKNRYMNGKTSSNGKSSNKDFRIPCAIHVENGSLFLDECEITFEDFTDPETFVDNDLQGGSCCILVSNNSTCVTYNCSLSSAHYGVVTSQNGTCVSFGGSIKSKIAPFMNNDETSSSRNYHVQVSSCK